jgi:hypothetical protein
MKPLDFQNLGAIFAKIKSRYDGRKRASAGLVCKQGTYNNCFVLKLQKPSWTNDPMDRLQNDSGIFFSVWIDAKAANANRAEYNIHALKLRELENYQISSRDFAADFRSVFAAFQSDWPNVSTNYGPLTLMQGWVNFAPDNCEAAVFPLLERFEQLSPVIDRLLAARRVA